MTVEFLSRHFIQAHPQDAARVFEQFPPDELIPYLQGLPPATLARLFRHLSTILAATCLSALPDEQAGSVLRELGVEWAAIFLRRIPPQRRRAVLDGMPAYHAGMLRLVLRYPDGTVGQLMDPDVVSVNRHTRIGNVIEFIRRHPERLEHEIYVVDEQHRLLGSVDVKDLITAARGDAITAIMQPPRYCLPARTRRSGVAAITGNVYRDFYPVIDHGNRFLGILRHAVLQRAPGDGRDYDGEDDLTSGLLLMADLFWKTCVNLLIPDHRTPERRDQDD